MEAIVSVIILTISGPLLIEWHLSFSILHDQIRRCYGYLWECHQQNGFEVSFVRNHNALIQELGGKAITNDRWNLQHEKNGRVDRI